jgi:hypothetical protein
MRSRPFAGHSRLLVCASVLHNFPPAAPPASPVAPALAPARGMIRRVLYIPNQLAKWRVWAKISFGMVKTKHPPKKKRNSYERTVVKADTPTVNVTERNEKYCAPWIVESPGGTVTTSAYNDGKRCLSAEGGSDSPITQADRRVVQYRCCSSKY